MLFTGFEMGSVYWYKMYFINTNIQGEQPIQHKIIKAMLYNLSFPEMNKNTRNDYYLVSNLTAPKKFFDNSKWIDNFILLGKIKTALIKTSNNQRF